jgi:glyoxylase-like metal-dependent hydrolase (beta-lactamase superfamily II)
VGKYEENTAVFGSQATIQRSFESCCRIRADSTAWWGQTAEVHHDAGKLLSHTFNQELVVKTEIFLPAATALLLVCGSLTAESIPLKSVNKANEVIDAAIEAHGGADALDGLTTLARKSEFVTIATGQSRKPGPPYDKGRQSNLNAIDLENEIFVNQTRGEGGGYVFEQGVIINGEDSWQLNQRSGTAAPLAEPDFHTQSGPFIRVTPALLMKQLQARRQQSNWLGEAEVDGRLHDVITLVMEVGPVLAMYIDQESHMLTRMERALPPFGQVEYSFLDYTMIDGIAFNQKFKLFVNGDDNLVIDIEETKLNVPMDQYVQVPTDLGKVAAITPDELSSNEIDEGVFLIGGNGTYALFVEMADHVVAIGGTQTVPASISEMRNEISDKPIKYGVLTHHHNDHVPGAAAYAQEGATIITFEENATVVRNAAGDDNAKLEFVRDHMTLTDGKKKVELFNIGPTPHAENILIAYLPDEGIIFEADHFPQPATGVIPPAAPATVAFAKALDKLDLDYKMIVGAHSARIARPADLETALSRQPMSATGGQ